MPLIVMVRQRETTHGAPGFNPLDFVSPEEREKMKRRMAQLKERLMKMRAAQGRRLFCRPRCHRSICL